MVFKPHFEGMECDEIGTMLFDSVMKCDIDLHEGIYSNFVLSGWANLSDICLINSKTLSVLSVLFVFQF
jgi:hypothetical protein